MEEFWNFKLNEFVMAWPAEWRYSLLTLYLSIACSTFALTLYFVVWPERERNRLAGTGVALLVSAGWPLLICMLPSLVLFGLMQIWDELRKKTHNGWTQIKVIGQTGAQIGVVDCRRDELTLTVVGPGQAWPAGLDTDKLYAVETITPGKNTYVVQHRNAADD